VNFYLCALFFLIAAAGFIGTAIVGPIRDGFAAWKKRYENGVQFKCSVARSLNATQGTCDIDCWHNTEEMHLEETIKAMAVSDRFKCAKNTAIPFTEVECPCMADELDSKSDSSWEDVKLVIDDVKLPWSSTSSPCTILQFSKEVGGSAPLSSGAGAWKEPQDLTRRLESSDLDKWIALGSIDCTFLGAEGNLEDEIYVGFDKDAMVREIEKSGTESTMKSLYGAFMAAGLVALVMMFCSLIAGIYFCRKASAQAAT